LRKGIIYSSSNLKLKAQLEIIQKDVAQNIEKRRKRLRKKRDREICVCFGMRRGGGGWWRAATKNE
jgi:hypothetical protein